MHKLPDAPMNRATLLEWLDASGIETTTYDHPAFFTVEEGAAFKAGLKADGVTGGNTKNLFLKDKKGRHFLLTALEDTEIDLKQVHRLLGGQGRVSFGRAEQMEAWLGVSPGSVTALGVVNDREGNITFALDSRAAQCEHLFCHPLTNEASTRIAVADLLKVAEASGHPATVVDLSATADV
ncbi:MAG: prolyl-tRNA synthetase associated domain-containing protein [Pseudomonadota bacterium]